MARTTQESSKITAKRKSASSAGKKASARSAASTATGKSTAKGNERQSKATKLVQVTSQQRHELIAEAAYLRAEQRGFQSDPTEDWLLAEQEIDEQLSEHAIAS